MNPNGSFIGMLLLGFCERGGMANLSLGIFIQFDVVLGELSHQIRHCHEPEVLVLTEMKINII